MKKNIFAVLLTLFSLPSLFACISGGPGATSCSHSTGGLFGLFSVTYEVSCEEGLYACCTSSSATCVDPCNEPEQ